MKVRAFPIEEQLVTYGKFANVNLSHNWTLT